MLEHGERELIEAVERGAIAVSTAATLTQLAPELQREVVKAIAENPHAATNAASEVRRQERIGKLRCQRAKTRRIWPARTDVVDPKLPMDSYLRTHSALSADRRGRCTWSPGYVLPWPRPASKYASVGATLDYPSVGDDTQCNVAILHILW